MQSSEASMKLLLLAVLMALQGVPSTPVQGGVEFVRIRGRVTGMPSGIPAGLLTISLLSPGTLATTVTETSVQADGTFEFSKVAAGTYNLGLRRVTMMHTDRGRIQADKDISDLEIAAPPMITGRVVVDDGSPVPVQMSSPIPGGVLLLEIRVRSPGGPVTLESTLARRDGAFAALWLGPDSRVELGYVPFGYYVKSLLQGSTDLLTSPARAPGQDVVLTLTRTPPAGVSGVRVTGRVLGLESYPSTSSRWLQFRAIGNATPNIGETLLRPDGTFEMRDVLPATYRIVLAPSVIGVAAPPPLVVPATGLQNVEVRFTAR
jgi:hypothetical protein